MGEGLRDHLARMLREGCSSGPDAELVADVLWMASVAGLEPSARPADHAGEPPPVQPPHPSDGRADGPSARIEDASDEEEAELHPPAGAADRGGPEGEAGRSGIPLETPLLPLLSDGLGLARSLRPLRQDVVRPGRPALDEHGTAHAAGESGMLLPVWREPTERRFSVDLVVDVGTTMAVWHRTGAELRAMFERHGAFRDVRTWALDTDAATPVLFPFRQGRARPDEETGPVHRLRHLAGPDGRRLIVLLTDGVGRVWRDAEFKSALAERARRQPVAVLQVLPRRLWHRTALPTVPVSAQQNGGAPPVPSYRCTAPLPGLPPDAQDRAKITWLPVMEIRPNWLAPWARLLSGHAPGWTPLLATPLTTVDWPTAPPFGPTPADDPVEGVHHLRESVSPGTFQLACYLAAAPLTLPIMQLVQRAMLPRSTLTELAEIFLSGVLRRVHPPRPGENPDEVLYDFHPGVREELLGCVTTHDSLTVLGDVLTRVSERVSRVFGGASGFRALASLASSDPATAGWDSPLPPDSVPFARVALTVLESAGGIHGAAAQRIRRSLALGSGRGQEQIRERDRRQGPERDREQGPDRDQEQGPDRDQEQAPEQHREQGPEQDREQGPEQGPEQAPPPSAEPTPAPALEVPSTAPPPGPDPEPPSPAPSPAAAPAPPPGDTPSGTALVVTGLPVEYEAVRQHLVDVELLVHPSGTLLERGALPGTPWKVALAEAGAGNQAPATLVARAHDWVRPDVLLFVGLAGSVTDDVALGDVVVATRVYAFQGVVSTPEGYKSRPSAWPASHLLLQTARAALRHRPPAGRVHFKPIAATEVLLNHPTSSLLHQLLRRYDDAVAVEMESAGISYAAATALPALTVRGISDTADGRRVDDADTVRRQAAGAAAQAAAAVLGRLAVPDAGSGTAAFTAPLATVTAQQAEELGAAVFGGDHIDFRGGTFTGAVIGRQPTSPTVVPATLPPPTSGFTGRADAMATLLDALSPTVPPRDAVVVTSIAGLGGIGKTALAVQAAHAARERGWFPGGTLFLDLRGYSDDPVTADQAVTLLLEALGAWADHLPSTVDARLSLYRTLLARATQPLLIIADNASSPEQVAPLVPADPRHRLVVVSRSRMPSLDARSLVLGELSREASTDLLDNALRIARPSDDRVARHPADADALAQLCGRLPLALQIAAARLAADPHMSIAELVAELQMSHDRLESLSDGTRDVRSVFDSSYRRLTSEEARVLRLLAAAPGPDLSTEALTALLGEDAPPFRVLAGLERAHLVTRGSNRSRWSMHDLVRVYALGVAAGERAAEVDAARSRLLAFYAQWAEEADERLRAQPGEPLPGRFETRSAALAWLDGERANLVGAVLWAADTGHAPVAIRLALAITEYLSWRGFTADWIRVSECAALAARHGGDMEAEAVALGELGRALEQDQRPEEAVEAALRAGELLRGIGHHEGEAAACHNLGRALRAAGRLDESIDAFTRALHLHEATGGRTGEGAAWNGLGLALAEAGRLDEAITALSRARDIRQETGQRTDEGVAWFNLGLVLSEAGRVEEAIAALGTTLAICRELGDWYGVGEASSHLGALYAGVDSVAEARAAWEEALPAYEQADAPEEARQVRERLRELGDVT
ncbi:SAV_2336 N-terminal domain-related protein [Streptomyces cinerochromogenes]|uniref:SAV_2336 N-terminal domain-related protein n=1 Tax=Streptomyces cinerochromogenes TaxID=66422 RepID=UPI00167057DE|nr:SAV_2336 N-terminal domain-related protein [Streptomyces cinerochromogenes]GGS76410.1 hypothetical protein GCM10010206_43480 [Streptomyces cinerochromogenes]